MGKFELFFLKVLLTIMLRLKEMAIADLRISITDHECCMFFIQRLRVFESLIWINYDCIQRIVLPLLPNFTDDWFMEFCVYITRWRQRSSKHVGQHRRSDETRTTVVIFIRMPQPESGFRTWSFLFSVARGCFSQPLIE